MTTQRPEGSTGSRYLFDPFDATSARIEANERVHEERWSGLEFRLQQIETTLERMERRIWLAVYGVAAFMLAQGAEVIFHGWMK